MDIVQIMENQLKTAMDNYAIFDKDFTLLESHIDGLDKSFSQDDIYIFDGRKCNLSINFSCEKNFIIKTPKRLVPVCFRPLFDYKANEIVGYEAKKLTLGELLGDRYVPKKFCSSARRGLTEITANTDMLEAFLEDTEIYEGFNYVDGVLNGCVKVLSTIANSETVNSIFNSPIYSEPHNISVLLEDILRYCEFDFRDAMEFDCEIEKNVWVNIEPSHFMSAVLNLLVNAYVYNNSEEKIVRITLKKDCDNAVLTITDNGVGINSVDSDDINFSSAKEGLGLVIANLLATLFGGDFKIASVGDYEGTTARIVLPLCTPSNVKSQKHSSENFHGNRFSNYCALIAKAKIQR